MSAREPQKEDKASFQEQLQMAQSLARFPAMTLMVVLRRDIGFRALNPLGLGIVCAFMFLLGSLATHPENRPQDLQVFAGLVLGLGMFQWLLRLRDFNRGVQQHSYYLGTSCFELPFMPPFLRSERRLARFVDPAFSALLGLALYQVSPALGMWIIFSALCLRLTEFTVHRIYLHQRLDLVDAMGVSEFQGQMFERFYPAQQSPGPNQPDPGISTGLGDDIQGKVRPNPIPAPRQAARQSSLVASILKPPLTRSNVVLAFLVAILADALHLVSHFFAGWAANVPLIANFAPGLASMGQTTELAVDCIAMLLTIVLVGFNWVLLPSVFVPFIPGLMHIPTWTGCVAYAVWKRRKDPSPPPAGAPATETPQAEPEARLARLAKLHRQGLINDEEYQKKRRVILEDL